MGPNRVKAEGVYPTAPLAMREHRSSYQNYFSSLTETLHNYRRHKKAEHECVKARERIRGLQRQRLDLCVKVGKATQDAKDAKDQNVSDALDHISQRAELRQELSMKDAELREKDRQLNEKDVRMEQLERQRDQLLWTLRELEDRRYQDGF